MIPVNDTGSAAVHLGEGGLAMCHTNYKVNSRRSLCAREVKTYVQGWRSGSGRHKTRHSGAQLEFPCWEVEAVEGVQSEGSRSSQATQ